MVSALRAGRPLADREFDRIYPASVRALSAKFWTPVAVARRAASLMVGGGASRVLDVGAGVGKVTIIGALVTSASWTGVEERADRVRVARRAAAEFGLADVTFAHGRMEDVALDDYDAFYLFNPFAEVLVGSQDPAAVARYARDVQRMEAALAAARPGARVVTYHGFGGSVPVGYRLVAREESGTGPLECWEKIAASAHPGRAA